MKKTLESLIFVNMYLYNWWFPTASHKFINIYINIYIYKYIYISLEVQDLKKYVPMKIRRKWAKKVRPCKILMMYLLRPYWLKRNVAINLLLMYLLRPYG